MIEEQGQSESCLRIRASSTTTNKPKLIIRFARSNQLGFSFFSPLMPAVQAAVGASKERIVEAYRTDEITVTRDTSWRIEGTKPGYYPMSVDYIQGWSGAVLSHPEGIDRAPGAFAIYGFASAVFGSSSSFVAQASVVWVPV